MTDMRKQELVPPRLKTQSRGKLEFIDGDGYHTEDEVELLEGGNFRSVDGRRRYVRRGERLYRNLTPGPSSFPFVGTFSAYTPKPAPARGRVVGPPGRPS